MMRCPDCQHTQRYREGTRCKKCGYQFILRRKSDEISDYALHHLIKKLSDNGAYAFTATQLILDLCRYWRRRVNRELLVSFIGIVVMGAVLGFFVRSFVGMWFVTLASLFFASLALWAAHRRKTFLPLPKARQIVQRYHQAHPIAELADGRAFAGPPATENTQDFPYAPERIVVVERDELVDLLVRNRFHQTHKAAVISRSGYPQRIADQCRSFLQRHPQMPVQLLHDASLPGFAMGAQLAADPNWPLAGRPLVDLGLSREAIENVGKLSWLPTSERGKGKLSRQATRMLNAGYRVPVDFMGPKPFLNLIGAAAVGGALVLLASNQANADPGGEFGVEIDDFG